MTQDSKLFKGRNCGVTSRPSPALSSVRYLVGTTVYYANGYRILERLYYYLCRSGFLGRDDDELDDVLLEAAQHPETGDGGFDYRHAGAQHAEEVSRLESTSKHRRPEGCNEL